MSSFAMPVSLRQRQTDATREQILTTAMALLAEGKQAVSHELIAQVSGMSARTVYRHFPDRSELAQAIWVRMREQMGIRFPNQEPEIVREACALFRTFDEHAALMQALLSSGASGEVRNRGGAEGRAAFASGLAELLKHAPEKDRRRVIAAFVAVYSAPFWQMLRERGGLEGRDVEGAVSFVLEAMLGALRRGADLNKKEETE